MCIAALRLPTDSGLDWREAGMQVTLQLLTDDSSQLTMRKRGYANGYEKHRTPLDG